MSFGQIKRIPLGLLALALVILAYSSQAQAAGPRLILVHGGGLTKPIVLDNFQENISLMRSISEDAGLATKELDGRPYFELTFFSGPYWVRYVEEGKPLDEVRPESGDQRGRFYPALRGAAPVITYDVGLARRIAPEGIAILSRHGIPIVVRSESQPLALAMIVGSLAIGFLFVIAARLIRHRRR